jgi:nicotinate-nucleotide adenylyltransferase
MHNTITGILGGTFDPIHNGHLRMASSALEQGVVDKIKFVPCNRPAIKSAPQTSSSQRVAMLKLAITDLNNSTIDCCEIERGGVSYTADTLQKLQHNCSDTLALIIGADAFNNFNKWRDWQTILQTAHLIIVPRPGYELSSATWAQDILQQTCTADELKQFTHGKILLLDMPTTPISSSEIRANKAKNLPPEGVPDLVQEHILQHKLYT